MAARAKFGQTARRVLLIKHPYCAVDKQLHAVNLKENWGFTDDV